ncbi:MAG: hypothetical protein GF311_21065 [Candidatus Lokiarchaeota archaeon]|nr:hypothetical protein [Candidatus Lokiarchaeota archaeon]
MDKRYNYKWNKMEWTIQARELLKKMGKLPEETTIGVILRHSHRYRIDDPTTSSSVKLTPMGIEFAKYFGSKLPKNRPIKIYHSIANRCINTALGIETGLMGKNRKNAVLGNLKILYDLEADGEFVASEMMKYTGFGFLNRWKEGYYSRDKIISFQEYCHRTGKKIWKMISLANAGSIFLFITHDLHLVAMMDGWFGMKPSNDWVSYLAGFAFTLEDDFLLYLDNNQVKRIEYPRWWISDNSKLKERR